VLIGGFLGIAILSSGGEHELPWWVIFLGIVFFFAWGGFVIILGHVVANKLNNKIISKLSEDCDPQAFINRYQKILGERKIPELRQYMLLNLCSAYGYLGEEAEVQKILNELSGQRYFTQTGLGAQNKVAFMLQIASHNMFDKNVENAERAIENAKEVLENPKLHESVRARCYEGITAYKFEINMLRGEYGGAEDYFTIAFDRAKTKLERVGAKYRLGTIYIHFGESEKAEEAFRYVVENGNKTYYVAKAKEQLAKLMG